MNSLAIDHTPPRELRDVMPFRHQLVTFDVEDGVGIVRIRRERAHHSLNPAAVYQLSEAVNTAQKHPLVHGIVITGTGATFSHGADLNYFIAAIEQGRVDKILEFTQAGNECFDAIERCTKPVVAALNGSALGGGLELALACGQRIATRGASVAFPEAKLGLLPGWGGISRSRRMLSSGLAKWLVYTGQTLSAGDAYAIGLVDRVTTPPQLLADAKSLALHDPASPAAFSSAQVRFDATSYAAFLQSQSVDDIDAGRFATRLNTDLAELVAIVRRNGLESLQRAEQLFALVETSTPQDLAAANLRLVDQAFRSEDVYRRLKATQAALLQHSARHDRAM